MAENSSKNLNWILEIDQQRIDYLAPIRHWSDLKMAVDQGLCLVKGFTAEQLEMPEIRSIPFKRLFYEKENRLYPSGSLLPVKRMSTTLLWMPLERGLPLRIPSFNHNYFGIDQRLIVRLIPSAIPQPSFAMLISLDILGHYIHSAPAIRLQGLSWILVDEKALVLGSPLLPLPGETWWRKDSSLLPSGYDWEWSVLSIRPGGDLDSGDDQWLLWDRNGSYMPVPKTQCQSLSLSSFRLTMASLAGNHPNIQ